MASTENFEYILIEPLNIRWHPGKRMLQKEMGDDYERYYPDFLWWLAHKYRDTVQESIDEQRWKKTRDWPPLSIGYYKYKEKHDLSLKMWEATGYLKEHIKIINKNSYLVVGFGNDTYPDSAVKLLLVAKVLEYGSDKVNVPPRPLFKPVYRYIGRHVRRYWEKYVEEV